MDRRTLRVLAAAVMAAVLVAGAAGQGDTSSLSLSVTATMSPEPAESTSMAPAPQPSTTMAPEPPIDSTSAGPEPPIDSTSAGPEPPAGTTSAGPEPPEPSPTSAIEPPTASSTAGPGPGPEPTSLPAPSATASPVPPPGPEPAAGGVWAAIYQGQAGCMLEPGVVVTSGLLQDTQGTCQPFDQGGIRFYYSLIPDGDNVALLQLLCDTDDCTDCQIELDDVSMESCVAVGEMSVLLSARDTRCSGPVSSNTSPQAAFVWEFEGDSDCDLSQRDFRAAAYELDECIDFRSADGLFERLVGRVERNGLSFTVKSCTTAECEEGRCEDQFTADPFVCTESNGKKYLVEYAANIPDCGASPSRRRAGTSTRDIEVDAGIAGGVLAGLVIIVLVVVYIRRRNNTAYRPLI